MAELGSKIIRAHGSSTEKQAIDHDILDASIHNLNTQIYAAENNVLEWQALYEVYEETEASVFPDKANQMARLKLTIDQTRAWIQHAEMALAKLRLQRTGILEPERARATSILSEEEERKFNALLLLQSPRTRLIDPASSKPTSRFSSQDPQDASMSPSSILHSLSTDSKPSLPSPPAAHAAHAGFSGSESRNVAAQTATGSAPPAHDTSAGFPALILPEPTLQKATAGSRNARSLNPSAHKAPTHARKSILPKSKLQSSGSPQGSATSSPVSRTASIQSRQSSLPTVPPARTSTADLQNTQTWTPPATNATVAPPAAAATAAAATPAATVATIAMTPAAEIAAPAVTELPKLQLPSSPTGSPEITRTRIRVLQPVAGKAASNKPFKRSPLLGGQSDAHANSETATLTPLRNAQLARMRQIRDRQAAAIAAAAAAEAVEAAAEAAYAKEYSTLSF